MRSTLLPYGQRWPRQRRRPFRQAHPLVCDCTGHPCPHVKVIPSMSEREIARRIGARP